MSVQAASASSTLRADVAWTDAYVEVVRSELITERMAVIVEVPRGRWVVGLRVDAPVGIERIARVMAALMAGGLEEEQALAGAMTFLIPAQALDLAQHAGICGMELADALDVTIEALATRFQAAGLVCPVAEAYLDHGVWQADISNVIPLNRIRGLRRQAASCAGCSGPTSPVASLVEQR